MYHPDQVIANLERLAHRSKNPQIQQRLKSLIARREDTLRNAAATYRHEPFAYLPSNEDLGGWWRPGALPDGRPLALLPPTGLTVFVATKGAGKSSALFAMATQAFHAQVPVLFCDNKHGDLAELPIPLPQLSSLEASMSLGKQGEWLSEIACMELFTQGLEDVAYIHSGTLHLHQAANNLFAQQDHKDICLTQLVAELRRLHRQAKQYGKSQQLESAINALRRVIGADGRLFACTDTLPIEQRFQKGHLIKLAGESPEAKRLAINLLRQLHLKYAQSRGHDDRSLHWLVIADDGRQLIHEMKRGGAVAVDLGQDLLDRAQSAGQGLVVATQSCAGLPQNLVMEADLVVMIGQQIEADTALIARRMGMSPAQRAYLQSQPPYHAVFHYRQGYTQPFPIVLYPPDEVLLPTDEVRLIQSRQKQAFMCGLQPALWTPPGPTEKSEADQPGDSARPVQAASSGLGADARQLLLVLCSHPYLLQTEAYELCGSKGYRRLGTLVAELEGRGLIKVHSLAGCKPVEVLEAAGALVQSVPAFTGRGGFLHRWLCARLQAYHKALGHEVKLEFAWERWHFDVWVRDGVGDVRIFEVVLSHSNLETTFAGMASIAAASRSVVCEDTGGVKKIKAAMKKLQPRLIAEVMAARKMIQKTKRVCLEGASV